MKIALILTMLSALVLSAVAASDLSADGRIPDDSRDMAQRAAQKLAAQRYDEAAGLYRVILQAHPDCLYAWFNLGVVRFQQGQYGAAHDAFEQSLALNPKDDVCLANIGIAEYQMNDFAGAVKHLAAALELRSDNEAAHEFLGRTYDQLGRHDEAQIELKKAAALQKKRSLHYIRDTIEDDSSRNSS